MVTEWGMSERLGWVRYAGQGLQYLGGVMDDNASLSPETREAIDAEVKHAVAIAIAADIKRLGGVDGQGGAIARNFDGIVVRAGRGTDPHVVARDHVAAAQNVKLVAVAIEADVKIAFRQGRERTVCSRQSRCCCWTRSRSPPLSWPGKELHSW